MGAVQLGIDIEIVRRVARAPAVVGVPMVLVHQELPRVLPIGRILLIPIKHVLNCFGILAAGGDTRQTRLDNGDRVCVEEGFRNIHDYSKLGRSPLVELFEIEGVDHIECGKQVQRNLIYLVEKLRPRGNPPPEPLPREWHSYIILYDAYVEEKLARDIMGKLYISEGTYYRTRRRALRGVARALLEAGTFA